MSQDSESTHHGPRIAELEARFRDIGRTAMRDLPLYNAGLDVEAVGFHLVERHWIGVLITPWFMNLMRLPERIIPMEVGRLGTEVKVVLPSGETALMLGGDEAIGCYESLSLHSPMSAFNTQDEARLEAVRRLQALLAVPGGPDADQETRSPEQRQRMSRRAFLRGARSDS